MRLFNVGSLLIGSFFLITFFQNCGGVDFNSGLANAQLSEPLSDGGLDVNLGDAELPPMIEDQINEQEEDPGLVLDEVEVPTPNKEEDRKDLEVVLNQNEACRDHFGKVDPDLYPWKEKLHITGLHPSGVKVANVGELKVSGLAKSIVGKNIDVASISGIYGSICLQANRIDRIAGITTDRRADIVLMGPQNDLGFTELLSGINNSDLVLINYEVKLITGIGRNLHIFGGRVHRLIGIFDEIHLYDGAVIENFQGINRKVIRH